MKILIATGLYPPDIGGPATYTVFLEKHLPRYGIDFTVLAYGLVRKYPPILRHLLYTYYIIRRARSVDVLYALDTVSVGLPVLLASFITRTPYMLRVPGDYAWEQGQQRYGITEDLDTFSLHKNHPLPVRILRGIQRMVARSARHIIVPSDYMKRVVTGWGIAPENVTRVYSALKSLTVSEDKATLRNRLGYEGFVVVSAGRLVPWKGFHILIESIAALVREGLPVSLHILGDGVCRKELETLVHERGVSDVVTFHGNVSRDCMAEYITGGDVFVLNTSYEGLSHQLIEVMSLGVPIITTPVGGNPELITDGETGVLVPYNDESQLTEALRRVIHDPAGAAVRVHHARTRTAVFHEDVASEAFVQVVKSLWKL